jgi:predicted PurR-regulated permease PerM
MDITEQVTQSIGGYISGMVALAAMSSIIGFIAMTIVGVPFAAILALILFGFGLIPLIGPLLGWSIVVIVALFDQPLTAFIIGIFALVYMQIEAYVLTPRVMNKAVSVPGSLVVIGAMAGGTLLGLLGALIAIPVAAMILIIIKQVWMPQQEKR